MRELVRGMCIDWGVSIRGACGVLQFDTSTFHYKSRRNELGLQLRNKHPKRRVKAKLREDGQEAAEPNEVWAKDFVHDRLAMGKKFRILTVVDMHSRL